MIDPVDASASAASPGSAPSQTPDTAPEAATPATATPATATPSTTAPPSGPPSSAPPPKLPVPGTEPRRKGHPKVHWELIACGLHGHYLVGTDAAEIRPEDAWAAWVIGSQRLHRCLRCDTWVPVDAPSAPARQYVPAPADVGHPLKGKALRDRYVLRLIVLDRAIHVVLLSALAIGIFLFAADKRALHRDYLRWLQAWQAGFGGPASSVHTGLIGDIDHLFTLSTSKIYLIGGVVTLYAVVLVAEIIGLWRARRWAEYLTFIETASLIPLELYEISSKVTALRILTLVVNLAIVLYLLIVHRLFGIRGGKKAESAIYGAEESAAG